jgi:hypothetical protein
VTLIGAIAGLAGALACLGGCGDSTSVDVAAPPLGSGGTGAQECQAYDGATAFTLGNDVLINRSADDVRIESVTMLGAENVRLLATSVIHYTTRTAGLMGTQRGYPPLGLGANGFAGRWSSRTPAVGATISPVAEPTELMVGVRIVNPDRPAEIAGISVTYTGVNLSKWILRDKLRYVFRAQC